MAELRWNPLVGEWVITGASRRERPAMREAAECALCTDVAAAPSRSPESPFAVVVVEAPLALLRAEPPEPSVEGTDLYPVAPARGACEMVIYSPDHGSGLADASIEALDRIVRVWTDRCVALAEHQFVRYIHVVDGAGDVWADAPSHPHGRILAFSFVPPGEMRKLARAQEHFDRNERCLLCDVLAAEESDGRRIVSANHDFVAFVPFAAKAPFEVQIVPRRHLQSLPSLDRDELRSLAAILRSVLDTYGALFGRPFTYLIIVHQDPTDGREYQYYHLHIEVRSPEAPPTAGRDVDSGTSVNLTPAEDAAAILRDAAPASE